MANKKLNKIQIDINTGNAQDQIFFKMYGLIQPRKKKNVLKKALAYYLMNEEDSELENYFGESLKEAKILAKVKLIRTKIVAKKVVEKTEVTPKTTQLKEDLEEGRK